MFTPTNVDVLETATDKQWRQNVNFLLEEINTECKKYAANGHRSPPRLIAQRNVLLNLLGNMKAEPTPDREKIIAAARSQYAEGSDNDIEIDDNAVIAADPWVEGDADPEDRRWWVQAWVYVRPEDL